MGDTGLHSNDRSTETGEGSSVASRDTGTPFWSEPGGCWADPERVGTAAPTEASWVETVTAAVSGTQTSLAIVGANAETFG